MGRSTGRLGTQIRSLHCERSVISRADGSAKWSQGSSCVLAAVYGPRQASARKENSEKAILEVSVTPRAGLPGPIEREYEGILRRTLERMVEVFQFARTSIAVVIQVINSDGALLACAINAACAALVDAGVLMNSMCAATACCISADSQLLLDPEAQEEQAASSVITLAFPYHFNFPPPVKMEAAAGDGGGSADVAPVLSMSQGVMASHTLGSFTTQQYFTVLDACWAGSSRVAEFSRAALAKSFGAT